MYSLTAICEIVKGRLLQQAGDDSILHLAYDSRRIHDAEGTLFFALKTAHNDGHLFLSEAYKRGVRNFVVSEHVHASDLPGASIIQVADTLDALQKLAAAHRNRFHIPVIGITGSNGKTIVKEWLNQLLLEDVSIARSPKSFNSQIGVPLSVWQLQPQHGLGIFEAGVSKPGEMEKLAAIIQPMIGVLTNIGEAHSEGFTDAAQKTAEKLRLFDNCEWVIGREQDLAGKKEWIGSRSQLFLWGTAAGVALQVVSVDKGKQGTSVQLNYQHKTFQLEIPFTDDASIENAITCCCVLLVMGYDTQLIVTRIAGLHAIDMRLQLRHSFNDCLVINDSYSADITSLKIALDFLRQQSSGLSRTVILSEFFESGRTDEDLYAEIAQLLLAYNITKVLAIGERLGETLQTTLPSSIALRSYLSTEELLTHFRSSQFDGEIILVKGARRFGFERIAQLFEKKRHQTVLEINLNALAHNLKAYQALLKPGTKVMAMVKAFSYGSGGAEIASVLQYHNTDYLGVAYADEGVELVKAGVSLPVMVMNAEASSFQAIVDNGLEPVIYAFELLESFETYLRTQGLTNYPVHVEIETGMNRLGFALEQVETLAMRIAEAGLFNVRSVFTHLAASEEPAQDDFTDLQAQQFDAATAILETYWQHPFLKHISNSAAILRHPQLQKDMVRLGIGLYGIETVPDEKLSLQPVATLRATIAQLKAVPAGGTVSYNRRGVVQRDSVIATVRIGYADGYARRFGNGVGRMLVRGVLAPVIGTVCMDMTMIDVTGIAGVREGDDVIVFGAALPLQQVASWIGTIPYELMTGVSQRVKRVYFHE